MTNVTDMTKRRKAQLEEEAQLKKAENVSRMFSWLSFRKKEPDLTPEQVEERREAFNEQHPYERGSKDDPWMNN